MKNIFLAVVFTLVCAPAFADSCECSAGYGSGRVVTTTSNVVGVPVRVVRGFRYRVAQRRAVRLDQRATRVSSRYACCSAACEAATDVPCESCEVAPVPTEE